MWAHTGQVQAHPGSRPYVPICAHAGPALFHVDLYVPKPHARLRLGHSIQYALPLSLNVVPYNQNVRGGPII